MRRIVALSVASAATLGLISACAGQPGSNTQTPTSQPATGQSAASSKAPVDRPRQIKLDGIAPCSLLTASQQQQINARSSKQVYDDGLKAQSCHYYLTPGAYSLAIVTDGSASSWTDGSRPGQAQTLPPISGFPAVSHTVAENPNACDVIVDTADNEYLVATLQIFPGAESRFPEKCAAAEKVAEAGMTTLLASH